MQMTGMFVAIWGYLNANNDTRTKRKKETGKGEEHGLDVTTIENFLMQGKLLEAKLLEMRDKLNEKDNFKANSNANIMTKHPPLHNE